MEKLGHELCVLCIWLKQEMTMSFFLVMVQVGESGYRRLAPGQSVGLKHAGYVISLIRTEKVSCLYRQLPRSCSCTSPYVYILYSLLIHGGTIQCIYVALNKATCMKRDSYIG